ncbi:MAG: hypothetical protein ACYC1D_05190 [Acidimicrobiales bacterium]
MAQAISAATIWATQRSDAIKASQHRSWILPRDRAFATKAVLVWTSTLASSPGNPTCTRTCLFGRLVTRGHDHRGLPSRANKRVSVLDNGRRRRCA